MTRKRITVAAATLLALAACGGGGTEVRNGPQATHPSPSPLAQGLAVASTQTPACGHDHSCHHGHAHGNDGSQPIVD